VQRLKFLHQDILTPKHPYTETAVHPNVLHPNILHPNVLHRNDRHPVYTRYRAQERI